MRSCRRFHGRRARWFLGLLAPPDRSLSPGASGLRGLRECRPALGYRGRSSVRFSMQSGSLSFSKVSLTMTTWHWRHLGALWGRGCILNESGGGRKAVQGYPACMSQFSPRILPAASPRLLIGSLTSMAASSANPPHPPQPPCS